MLIRDNIPLTLLFVCLFVHRSVIVTIFQKNICDVFNCYGVYSIMTKKNMSLVKQTSNRLIIRSQLSPTDKQAKDEQPTAISPLQANVLWNYPALDSFSKLYIPGGQIDLEWQPSISLVFKVKF